MKFNSLTDNIAKVLSVIILLIVTTDLQTRAKKSNSIFPLLKNVSFFYPHLYMQVYIRILCDDGFSDFFHKNLNQNLQMLK